MTNIEMNNEKINLSGYLEYLSEYDNQKTF
jgi:hypothetical protein